MARVSVLMPLFNGEKFIEESLQSIQNQTYTDWEFIIVNDFGSNDGCAEIVKQYAEKDKRIKLIQVEKRLGLAASLNMGLDIAVGEYIARVDVDDPSEPTRLEKQVEFLDKHPEIILCGCWQRTVTPNNVYDQIVVTEPDDLSAYMMFGCEISHCGVMFRKKEFDLNNWRYNSSYLGEDFELWNRIIAAGCKIANIPEVLVSHRWGWENISIEKGEKLREEVRKININTVKKLGVNVEKYMTLLFSGWRNLPCDYAKHCKTIFLQQGYSLLMEIIENNKHLKVYNEKSIDLMIFDRWNWIRKSCGLSFKEIPYYVTDCVNDNPLVSVVMPTFKAVNDISRSIDSIISQSFKDWELLVINDYGSNDGTSELVKMYGVFDKRIKLIQADKRLGLAESINLGIRLAKGKYVARMDADDFSHVDRLKKQVALMEARPDVGLCGTWQHHYGPNCDWIHKATEDEKLLKARLIFWCDLCHSTLMLRKDEFIKNNLFYDSSYMAEDYELWTRAMQHMTIVNIPEVLGEYKNDGTGITANKFNALRIESGKITAKVLKSTLGIELTDAQAMLLNGWENQYKTKEQKRKALVELKHIYEQIWKANNEIHYFDSYALLQTLAAKWDWIKYDADWKVNTYSLDKFTQIFEERIISTSLIKRYNKFKKNNPTLIMKLKKVMKKLVVSPIANVYRKILRKTHAWIIDELKRSIEGWTWERYNRTRTDLNNLKKDIQGLCNVKKGFIPYYTGSKIRVLFVFQVASFWPAQERVYLSLLNDDRFDVKLVCYDDGFDKSIKTESARQYLLDCKYNFIPWEEFSIDDFNPHVVFLQTAYDTNRKPPYTSAALKLKGRRVVYIPYGIEIADTMHAREDHFRLPIIENAWRIYTISEKMRQEYLLHAQTSVTVRALGLPRFDALFNKVKFLPNENILKLANGRKIVLWKVHFPKMIKHFGKQILVTPDIQYYLAFADMISQMKDIFFIFMPHPRFKEFNDNAMVKLQTQMLMKTLSEKDNVYIDGADDYRTSLFMADAIIVDRSAVMIEAATVGVPVLYMYNNDYDEPMTAAVEPLVKSYYQGTNVEDMMQFIELVRENKDPKKEERKIAFEKCVPFYDGLCSKRITDDIASGVMGVLDDNSYVDIDSRLQRIEQQMIFMLNNQKRLEKLLTAPKNNK